MGYFKLLFAQPGSLDNSFGTGGKVITSFGSGNDEGFQSPFKLMVKLL